MSKFFITQLIVSFIFFTVLGLPIQASDVVVDNDDGAPGYIESGSWNTSSSTGFQGGTYRYTLGVTGETTASATWTPDLPSQRLYEVYATYRQSTNRATAAPITIAHSTGTTVIYLNQNGANQIVETYLGTFLFDAGTTSYVRMDNGGVEDNLIADAFIWRIPIDPAPEISNISRTPNIITESDPVTIAATITDNVIVAAATVSYTVEPSGITDSVPAFDDGVHGDGMADDSIYGAIIPAQPNGSVVAYSIQAADELGQNAISATYFYGVNPLPLYQPDIVVDNDDKEPGYIEEGSWTLSSSTGYDGGTYHYSVATSGIATSTATWTPDLPLDGIYKVYAAFAAGSNRPTSVPLTVTHAAGQTQVDLNQYGSSSIVEILIGEFPFEAGSRGSVRMENSGTTGACIADAFIWHIDSDHPPVIQQVSRNPVQPSATETVLVTAKATDNVSITTAAVSFTINGANPIVIPAFDDGLHNDGTAGDHVFGSTIPAQPDDSLISFTFTATDNLGQSSTSQAQSYVVGQEPKNVYVVLSSDTSIWSTVGYPGVAGWNVFESRTGVLSKVYSPDFRYQHVDSLGQPFKITWFMHGGAWFRTAVNSTPISAVYYIRKNWEDVILKWDDALEYHFHHYVYSGTAWEMAPTFAETIWEYEWIMSEMMIEEDLFITAFRSGWNYMDDTYQKYLERWVPFRMEGVQSGWIPYHPSFDNYREHGTMKGWEVRHLYMKSFTTSVANQVFAAADQGTDQVACIWSHQNEADYPNQIADVDAALHNAFASYPKVQFHYCTADEAMRKWLKTNDNEPPSLEIYPAITGDTVNVTIQTDDDIYQEQPWIAARRYAGDCVRLDSVRTGIGEWEFSYSRQEYDAVSVGVSDIFGNEVLADVDDGTRRWISQSEYAKCASSSIDIETLPTSVTLKNISGAYVASGTIAFDNQIEPGESWQSIAVVGDTTDGTSLQYRYKTADLKENLDETPWSDYQSATSYQFPVGLEQPWIRIEVLLEGNTTKTPELKSLEVRFLTLQETSGCVMWRLY